MANIVDAPNSQLDNTTRLFDSFYNFELVIDANRYEIVYSTLYEITKSVSDFVMEAAEKVGNIASQAADSTVSATKKAADVATQTAGTATEIAKGIGEKIKGPRGGDQ